MLNYLWAGMTGIGILWGALHGQLSQVTEGVLLSAREAVSLCITMLGILSFWTGILEIGTRAGLTDQLAGGLKPFLRFLFPHLPPEGEAAKQISINVIANMLGLGWAATPAGLRAMEELEKLEEERRKHNESSVPRGTASDEMCVFLILNISSLQLIPVNMIAYRSQYGSVNPAAVAGPAIAATTISTLAAVVFCRMMDRKRRV